MATAQTIIDRALRLIGAIGSGESPTAAETADALIALNALIDADQAAKQMMYTLTDTSYTASSGDGSYTVGPAGNFAITPRPPKLAKVFARISSIDYDIELVEPGRWFAIPDKSSQSDLPKLAYYDPTLATGTLLVWPVPNASISLHVLTGAAFGTLSTAGTTVTGPPGLEDYLAFNLAVRIAPEYPGAPNLQDIKELAREARATVMRSFNRPLTAQTELGHLLSGTRSDIFSGGNL